VSGGERPERRREQRFSRSIELRASKLTSVGLPNYEPGSAIRGRIQNISRGGACLNSKRFIAEASLIRCEIAVSGTGAAIPTLMRVQWTERSTNGYKIGLQFVL
jgi:hypothetical protein